MQKGIKFRIYPNREQKNFIHQTLGCCRLIYNRGLAMRKESYEEGKKIGYTQTSAMLTELKRQEEFAFKNVLPIQPSRANITGSSHTERSIKKIISVLWEDISNFRNLDLSKYASRWKWEKLIT